MDPFNNAFWTKRYFNTFINAKYVNLQMKACVWRLDSNASFTISVEILENMLELIWNLTDITHNPIKTWYNIIYS